MIDQILIIDVSLLLIFFLKAEEFKNPSAFSLTYYHLSLRVRRGGRGNLKSSLALLGASVHRKDIKT
ncbi:MAG: hypothetical protein A2W27_01790 [Deltaproteobacteria bacterium RBG_16_44_11]|nr:MAG: hypothetical protein A2W27_01790 [Deltaproteobacteria bacterium RBG_16_44_11]